MYPTFPIPYPRNEYEACAAAAIFALFWGGGLAVLMVRECNRHDLRCLLACAKYLARRLRARWTGKG
jgi:hypothetical protein